MKAYRPVTLDDTPCFIENVSDTLSAAILILLEMDRRGVPSDQLKEVDRVASMLTLVRDGCDRAVFDIESGANFPVRGVIVRAPFGGEDVGRRA